MAKFSVIILTYNREKYVAKAIESVLAQTYKDFELIVVDNGSTDLSGRIADEYVSKDSRVRVKHLAQNPNGTSIGAGRNSGVKMSDGEYITFVDDDDTAEPGLLEFFNAIITEYNADIAICGSRIGSDAEHLKDNQVYDETLVMKPTEAIYHLFERQKFNAGFWGKCIRREILEKVPFNENFRYEDIRTSYKVMAEAKVIVAKGEPQYNIFRHGNNNSVFTGDGRKWTADIFEEYFDAYRERTKWLNARYPEFMDYVNYSEWSFLISMYNKMETYDLKGCDKQKKYCYDIVKEHLKEFCESKYIKDFEKDFVKKYFTEKKRVLLYGHGGAYNHGAEAIIKTTLKNIKQIDPGAEIVLSTHFRKQDEEFNLKPAWFCERNEEYVKKQKEEHRRYDDIVYKETVDSINKRTVALSVGGDNYCYQGWEKWKYIHDCVKKAGGKDILWSCSIDPKMISDEMLTVLKDHDLITAREEITYRALSEKGLKNVRRCADVAFLLEPEECDIPTGFDIQNAVSVNVSPLIIRREKTPGTIMKRVYDAVDYILDKLNMNVVLVSHVVMPVDDDYTVSEEIFVHYAEKGYKDRFWLCDRTKSAAQYKYIISKCRFGIFARTHATIAAYSTGVPCIALGYSVKARGIAMDHGADEYVISVEDIDKTSLSDVFKKMVDGEEAYRKRLADRKEKEKELARLNFELLKEYL